MKSLEQLHFDNRFARLPNTFYSRVQPTPLPTPYLVSFNPAAATLLDLAPAQALRADFADCFAGNRLPPRGEPLAMLYAGHQFGQFVPQLGDGRAILLGEVKNAAGEGWEVQLKGAGPTPYSRRGDGRAVLRSSIREYLCSEAMHALGIPSTRALCIVGSDETVLREEYETAAVVTRLAPSHLRFGSFEVFFYRGQFDALRTLADYVIAQHFPHLAHAADKYAQWLNEVVTRTAQLMAHWQAVGFAHGVMNTDNMSILGLTFDYGPFGFMESYDPGYVCNHSDSSGRYAFDAQPNIGWWNLAALAHALSPLIPAAEAEPILDGYGAIFSEHYLRLMGKKIGVSDATHTDLALIQALLEMLRVSELDYTNFFRSLSQFNCAESQQNSPMRDQFINREAFDAWANNYRARLQQKGLSQAEKQARMHAANPKYILRNHLAHTAIVRAQQERDFSEVDTLLKLLSQPYAEQNGMERYTAPAPDWAKNLEISCSS